MNFPNMTIPAGLHQPPRIIRLFLWIFGPLFLTIGLNACLSSQPRGTLHLTVTERGTGLPVKSAEVKVHPIEESEKVLKSGKTDTQGRVKFSLPRGAYSFEIEKVGFTQSEEDTNKLVQDIVNYATIQMEELVELHGFVTEPDGSPAENIQIILQNLQAANRDLTGATISDGSYAIKNIPAGRYDITFSSYTTETQAEGIRYKIVARNKLLQGAQLELNVQLERVIEEYDQSKDAPSQLIQPGGSAPGID